MGCDIHEMVEKRGEWGWENCGALGVGRNYNLFSILGNVRNDGKEPVPFIAEGRIEKERQEDEWGEFEASPEFCAWYKAWEGDAHSASYVTLAELKAFYVLHKDSTVFNGRLVLGRDEEGRITATCEDTNGKHLGPVGMCSIFGEFGDSYFTDLIVKMEARKEFFGAKSDNDIRLVFFFDN